MWCLSLISQSSSILLVFFGVLVRWLISKVHNNQHSFDFKNILRAVLQSSELCLGSLPCCSMNHYPQKGSHRVSHVWKMGAHPWYTVLSFIFLTHNLVVTVNKSSLSSDSVVTCLLVTCHEHSFCTAQLVLLMREFMRIDSLLKP